jgi:hypothetical protein
MVKVKVQKAILHSDGVFQVSWGAIQTGCASEAMKAWVFVSLLVLTRHGDWVMRVRFCGEITRECGGSVRQRLSTRAFRHKARSHDPITVPDRLMGTTASNQSGDAFCGGQGGAREAGGGQVAKRIAWLNHQTR